MKYLFVFLLLGLIVSCGDDASGDATADSVEKQNLERKAENTDSEIPDTYFGPHRLRVFDDYDKGLAYAKKIQKPVLLDFSGHNCVNSRKMENNVWGAPGVIEILRDELVIISLFVDDRTELPSDEQKMITDYRGRKVKLTTYGQKWSNLQVSRYKTNTQPYYRMLSPDGEDLSNGPGDYERHKTPQKFKAWLIKGLE